MASEKLILKLLSEAFDSAIHGMPMNNRRLKRLIRSNHPVITNELIMAVWVTNKAHYRMRKELKVPTYKLSEIW